MTRRATEIKAAQAESANLLVLDAGNSWFGDQQFSQQSQGSTSVEAMNRLGYDVMALASGDLQQGLDVLRQRMQEAKFDIISANLRDAASGELVAKPYTIRQVGDRPIAIIGLTDIGATNGVTIDDPLQTAHQIVPEAAKEANIVILLTRNPVSMARQIAAQVPQIDLIVCGGDEVLSLGETVNDGATLIVHADVSTTGHAGRMMGRLDAHFDSAGALTNQTNRILMLAEELTEDPEMLAWLQGLNQ